MSKAKKRSTWFSHHALVGVKCTCQRGRTRDASQARRLLALAVIYDGGSRSEAARVGGVDLQIVRDWVVRFNAEGPPGLVDRKAPGPSPRLNDEQRQRWRPLLSAVRHPRRTAWCAGGWWTWCSGFGTSSRCRSARKR